ncbi:hypothetical protein WCLP8_870006 [uncultured Gammaproteobacteria bacterium]
MARPRHKALALNSDERNQLNSLVRAHSTPQQLVLRARMILGLAEEGGLCAVAHDLGVWRKTVRHWRNRWLSAGGKATGVKTFSTILGKLRRKFAGASGRRREHQISNIPVTTDTWRLNQNESPTVALG